MSTSEVSLTSSFPFSMVFAISPRNWQTYKMSTVFCFILHPSFNYLLFSGFILPFIFSSSFLSFLSSSLYSPFVSFLILHSTILLSSLSIFPFFIYPPFFFFPFFILLSYYSPFLSFLSSFYFTPFHSFFSSSY